MDAPPSRALIANDDDQEPSRGGRITLSGWRIPTHPLEKCLSGSLSITDAFYGQSLAPGHSWRRPDGNRTWCILSGLLLGAHGVTLFWRGDESVMDRRNYPLCLVGKSGTHGRVGWAMGRSGNDPRGDECTPLVRVW